MGANGDRGCKRDYVQEQHDVPPKWLRHPLANQYFEPYPGGLIKTPHGHARCNQAPEEAFMSTAVACIPSRENERRRNNQKRGQVSHCRAKMRIRENDWSQGKAR